MMLNSEGSGLCFGRRTRYDGQCRPVAIGEYGVFRLGACSAGCLKAEGYYRRPRLSVASN